ncbi:hypothetical protein BH10ACT7_BH10ACT7_05130 [soil metagenome]
MKVGRTQAILVAVVGVVFLVISIGMLATGAGWWSLAITALAIAFIIIGIVTAVRTSRA